ncbi:hypothetical protein QUB64_29755, partial [Microcoleus sp. Aus8_D2]
SRMTRKCQVRFLGEGDMVTYASLPDILAIVHVFSGRLYGLRKYKTQIKEDPNLPRASTSPDLEDVDGSSAILLQSGEISTKAKSSR